MKYRTQNSVGFAMTAIEYFFFSVHELCWFSCSSHSTWWTESIEADSCSHSGLNGAILLSAPDYDVLFLKLATDAFLFRK